MTGPVPALADRAAACASRLRAADEVLLASHIDADGLTSAAVATTALARAGIPHEVHFFDQLDADALAEIAATGHETVLFTDFGSGQLPDIVAHEAADDFTPVVVDHHQPADVGGQRPTAGGTEPPAADTEYHLNPLLEGIDGAAELSGAGAAYVLARALEDPDCSAASGGRGSAGSAPGAADNRDLAALAVVGAVGDMQASGGALVGANRRIVEEGVESGVLTERTDPRFYGKQTRPLPKLLEYASDVRIPGVTGNQRSALRFLDRLDVDVEDEDGGWRRWVDLSEDERERVGSALLQAAVDRGVPTEKIENFVGTSYLLAAEEPGTELRDASEFSTLLNATARYDRADVGLAVCLGDRNGALDSARRLLTEHRRNLSRGVTLVEERGVERGEHVQWFHAGDEVRETIVGIVAGMALGADGVSRQRPIVAFAEKDDEAVKVSARAPPGLVRSGVDLSTVVARAAAAVDGEGGGHDVAAGATIPAGTEEEFLDAADAVVGDQLGDGDG